MTQKTILITGGTGKFGKIFSNYFIDNGWKVIITSTSQESVDKFLENVVGSDDLDIFICDLSLPNAPAKLIEDLSERGIQINHLVNNARSLKNLKVGETGVSLRDDMAKEYLLDVIVPYELAMNLYQLQKDSLQTITNIGSQYGNVAINPYLYEGSSTESPIQYGLAKSAVHHLTKELAVRFSKDNIRVNCVAYGGVEGRVGNDFKSRYAKLVPLGRMLREEEIIGPLNFLLSSSSSSVTGHILAADGGWTLW